MKLYFKHDGESEWGAGVAYLEFTDGWPSRQAEVYGHIWCWGDVAHPDRLADQPLERLGLEAVHAITAEEFERAWEEARSRCQPSS